MPAKGIHVDNSLVLNYYYDMTQTISQLHDLEEYTEILSKDTLSANEKTLEGISHPDVLGQIALGLTYHEICVLHFMLGKDKSYAPYASKALTVLTTARPNAPDWSLPMLDSYINSSRSLVAATKGNLISLLKVIRTYDELIDTYGAASYHPEFLQASLLENLPNVFGAHAKAKKRFESVISKYNNDPAYTTAKIISFCYLSLGKLSKDSAAKTDYLKKSIEIDTAGDGGSAQAKQLLETMSESKS